MRNLEFPSPISVQRFGQTVEIETVDEALALLMFWPVSHRGNAFQYALNGCEGALDGAVTAGEAREALAEFVDVTGTAAGRNSAGNTRRLKTIEALASLKH